MRSRILGAAVALALASSGCFTMVVRAKLTDRTVDKPQAALLFGAETAAGLLGGLVIDRDQLGSPPPDRGEAVLDGVLIAYAVDVSIACVYALGDVLFSKD